MADPRAFPPDIAALIPLLASVRARQLEAGGVDDQNRAEDQSPSPATADQDAA